MRDMTQKHMLVNTQYNPVDRNRVETEWNSTAGKALAIAFGLLLKI